MGQMKHEFSRRELLDGAAQNTLLRFRACTTDDDGELVDQDDEAAEQAARWARRNPPKGFAGEEFESVVRERYAGSITFDY